MLRIFLFISANIAIVSCDAPDKRVEYGDEGFLKYRNIGTCEGRPQTFWTYRYTYSSLICNKVIQKGLTAIEKKRILHYHNVLRQKVARGEETRGNPGPQPAATEMPKLEWDDELAALAQRWVQQCNFEHDQCRDVERFKVNQLIGKYDASDGVMSYDVKKLIDNWYNDVDTFDAESVLRYCNVCRNESSYTQIVWAETTKIGCGGIKYRIPDKYRFFLACNYGPAGNVQNESVYKTC